MNNLQGNEKIEKAMKNVLFGLMTNFENFKIVNSFNYQVTARDFDGVGSQLFSLCEAMHKEGHKKLTAKMTTESGIKEEEIRSYFEGVQMTDAEDFKLYMKELSVLKAVKEASEKLSQSIEIMKGITGSQNFDKMDAILSEVKKGIGRLDSLKKTEKGHNLQELNAQLSDISNSQMAIKTGMKEIDEKIGGFRRGETTILSGVSNQGKTTFANQLMVYIAYVLGLRVLYINLELTEKNAYAKSLGLLSGKGYAAHNPDSYDESNRDDVKAWEERNLKDAAILKDTVGDRIEVRTVSINETEMINTIYEADAEGFSVIFVDYFQLIDVGTDNSLAKAQKLSDLATNIRNATKETNLAVVLLAQLKENKKEEPMTFEISWCRDLYKTAGLEIRVWRNLLDEETGTFDNKIIVGFPKTRFSNRPEPIPFLFDGAVGRIGSLSDFKSVNDESYTAQQGRRLREDDLTELFEKKPQLLNFAEVNVSFLVEMEQLSQARKGKEKKIEIMKEVVKVNNEIFDKQDRYDEEKEEIIEESHEEVAATITNIEELEKFFS